MTRTRIKICGITRERDAQVAARAGADALGFVFWSGSPRAISPEAAAAIGRALPPLVTRVGVFVNARPAEVARVVRVAGLDAVQLHGEETPDAYAECGAAIIKAVALVDTAALRRARAWRPEIALLVDASDPARRGGTGQLADWTLARVLARARPILLAGGLTPDNVRAAIRVVRPWGIDLSSGVETRPGCKSETAIAAVFARVAAADGEAS